MTFTSGGLAVATPSKDIAIPLPKALTKWIDRPRDDPQFRWSNRVMIPHPDITEYLKRRGIVYRAYVQRRPKLDNDPYGDGVKKWRYRLALRLQDRREAILLILYWRLNFDHISFLPSTLSSGIGLKPSAKTPSTRRSKRRSKNGSESTESNTCLIWDLYGPVVGAP